MKTKLIGAILLIAGSGIVLNSSCAQQLEQMPGIKRTDLQRHDISVPGHEAIQTRVDLAPGAAFPMHRHPGEEIIYVIEGSITRSRASPRKSSRPAECCLFPPWWPMPRKTSAVSPRPKLALTSSKKASRSSNW
ncbi:MAG: cupin domain-containing protein [Mesorhizobium sp.]|nr:MAG: cupin domain-containing protein [Mesorhizobium sp.]